MAQRRRRRNPRLARQPVAKGGLAGIWHNKIRPHITKKRLIIACIIGVIFIISLPFITYAYYARDISDKDRLINRNNTGVVLKDKNGTSFYSSGVLSSSPYLTLDQISDNAEKAVIASEDKDFYKHGGYSIRGIARAFTSNIAGGDATSSGGSTITQQLVKNKLLGSQKNYLRKFQEVSMAVAVERRYSKTEILEMYLNSAYFGAGAFGIGDAAKTYFNKSAADLTIAESSMLTGLLPAPSAYSPISGSPEKTEASQDNVLRKMVANKAITKAEADEADAVVLTYGSGAQARGDEYARHFADMVVKDLEKEFGEEQVRRSGYTVTTTIDLEQQKIAEQVVRDNVAKTTARGGKNAGVVAINPKNGHITALVGSVDYYNQEFGQVNMAVALRQPGSSFKPIYYSDAIDRKLVTAATILDDKATTFGGTYAPKNFDNRFKGEMPLRNALAESRNVPAVQVLQKEGLGRAVSAARRMGLSTVNDPQKYGLSLALGTAEVRLLDMTNAYAAFANAGKQYKPVFYTKVVDKYGNTVAKEKDNPETEVLSEEAAYITSSILSDTSARAPTLGTSLNISGKTAALKTGTTNDNRDAWTIGYTPSQVVGVWLGNNENQPMRGLAGGSGAGAMWRQIMTKYLSGKKREEFVRPSGVVEITICKGTELRAVNPGGDTRAEYFIKGAEPKGTCNERDLQKEEEERRRQEEEEKEKKNNENDPADDNPDQDGTGEDGDGTDTGTGTGTGGTGTGNGGGNGGGNGNGGGLRLP